MVLVLGPLGQDELTRGHLDGEPRLPGAVATRVVGVVGLDGQALPGTHDDVLVDRARAVVGEVADGHGRVGRLRVRQREEGAEVEKASAFGEVPDLAEARPRGHGMTVVDADQRGIEDLVEVHDALSGDERGRHHLGADTTAHGARHVTPDPARRVGIEHRDRETAVGGDVDALHDRGLALEVVRHLRGRR